MEGKSGNGGGKKGKSKDAGALAWTQQLMWEEHGGVVCTADRNKHHCWHNRVRWTRVGSVRNHDSTTGERE